MTLTRAQAITKFRQLTQRYGVQWTAGVPRASCDEIGRVQQGAYHE